MHITAQVEELRNALNKVLTVVDKKNTRPILTYTLINGNESGLEISATDLEVSAKINVCAKVENSIPFCVNGKNIFDILKELPNEELTLDINPDENILKIECLDIKYSLLIYRGNDFPPLAFENVANEFSIPANELLEIIAKTSHSMSSDETRLHCNGIFLHAIDSKLRAVATDGHRLSMIDINLDVEHIELLENGIIIPKKGVYELKKLAESDLNSIIKVSLDESFMYASIDNKYYLSVRLISREYPKYQKVIPTKSTYTLTTEKNNFYDAIKRIKIMSHEKSNSIKMRISSDSMFLVANHPTLGEAQEKINVQYNGPELEIGFSAKYLMDIISTFEIGEILLELNNEFRPVVIKSNNFPNYLGIIMPMKV